jgi:deazaflavin-dependent oxidoreductase (nitroreductase family)
VSHLLGIEADLHSYRQIQPTRFPLPELPPSLECVKPRSWLVLTGTYRRLLAAAGGRVLGRMGEHPLLILTSTGRRTGRPFSTPVIGIADGDDYLVVASNGGAATQPIWVRNIAANPRVTIRRGTLTQEREARFLTPAQRAQWWLRLVEAYQPYATMQAKTDRELPVLRLSPLGGAPVSR